MSEPYLLSPHVYVCVAGKHAVLLDLERDKYLAVIPAYRLARWVRGWPVPEPQIAEVDSGAESLLSRMVRQGLLVTDPAAGKEAAPVLTEWPESALLQFDLDTRTAASFRDLCHFLVAHAAARSALRLRPIRSVVEAVRRRKEKGIAAKRTQLAPGESQGNGTDLARARALVNAFVHLRPLFFTAHDKCLLDSLSLINFLARHRVYPNWVFGVKADPFSSHCWVQQGGVVFNDAPDAVRLFTPILVI